MGEESETSMNTNDYQKRDGDQLKIAINEDQITIAPEGRGTIQIGIHNDYSPSGFAGGAILAFVSDRDGNSEIYVMTDTGGAQNNITNNLSQDLDPAIHPGGNWIAFATDRDGNLEVYFVGTNGGTAYNLTRNPSQDRYPDW